MDEGIFIRFCGTIGGRSREVFVLSEELARAEVKREVEDYLKDPSDVFIHGDLKIEEERCRIWKSKPLKSKVNIVFAETWRDSGTCWAFACRNEREIKEVLRYAINNGDKQWGMLKAKVYRGVSVVGVAVATKNDECVNRITALKRELT